MRPVEDPFVEKALAVIGAICLVLAVLSLWLRNWLAFPPYAIVGVVAIGIATTSRSERHKGKER